MELCWHSETIERITQVRERRRVQKSWKVLLLCRLIVRSVALSVGTVEKTHNLSADHPKECPGYMTQKSDGRVPVMLELWGMQSTPLLPSLLGPLWPRMVVPNRVLSSGQVQIICVLMLHWIVWNRIFRHLNCVLMLNWIAWIGTVFACSIELF